MAAAVKLLLCLFSLTASNISCFALVSFFLTTLPTKRNLLIFFDILLVLALTCVVDIAVRIPFLLSGEKHFAESQFIDVIFSPLLLFAANFQFHLFFKVNTFSVPPSYASKPLDTHRPLWWES